MNRPYIEFKKQRDFGVLLSDTFNFIRHEFKPLLKTIFTVSAPALVLFIIATAFYSYSAGETANMEIFDVFKYNFTNPIFYLYYLTFFAAIMFLSSSCLHYIKSYVENGGNTNFEHIKRDVYKTITGYLGLGFLKWVTIMFASALCFLPVLYIMVPMFVAFSIYVFESKKNATDSYSKSYTLVNIDFWISLGIIIIIGILYYVLSLIFAIPAVVYSLIDSGIFAGEIDPASALLQPDPVFILLNVISNFFSISLNLIPIVSGAFLYFHLNEKTNFTGTYERISNIGNTEE